MVRPFEDMEPTDLSRIDIYQLDEFNYWINRLQVAGDALVEAVFTVGNERTDVEYFLKNISHKQGCVVG